MIEGQKNQLFSELTSSVVTDGQVSEGVFLLFLSHPVSLESISPLLLRLWVYEQGSRKAE